MQSQVLDKNPVLDDDDDPISTLSQSSVSISSASSSPASSQQDVFALSSSASAIVGTTTATATTATTSRESAVVGTVTTPSSVISRRSTSSGLDLSKPTSIPQTGISTSAVRSHQRMKLITSLRKYGAHWDTVNDPNVDMDVMIMVGKLFRRVSEFITSLPKDMQARITTKNNACYISSSSSSISPLSSEVDIIDTQLRNIQEELPIECRTQYSMLMADLMTVVREYAVNDDDKPATRIHKMSSSSSSSSSSLSDASPSSSCSSLSDSSPSSSSSSSSLSDASPPSSSSSLSTKLTGENIRFKRVSQRRAKRHVIVDDDED
jgi:hypothetical protein